MRTLIQRVSEASVKIAGKMQGQINKGFLVLLGITHEDTEEDIDYLVRKIINLRVFSDHDGLMNESLLDQDGEVLAISQFTLFASTKKGNRPSFTASAKANTAEPLYELFINKLSEALNKPIAKGIFGADMQVQLINDGPVTIALDSRNRV